MSLLKKQIKSVYYFIESQEQRYLLYVVLWSVQIILHPLHYCRDLALMQMGIKRTWNI